MSSPHQLSCNLHSSSASFSKPRPLENVPIVIISSRRYTVVVVFSHPRTALVNALAPLPPFPRGQLWEPTIRHVSSDLLSILLTRSCAVTSLAFLSPRYCRQFDEVAKFAYNRAHPHFSIRKAVNRQGVVSGWLRDWTVNPGAGVRLLWKTVFFLFFFSLSSSQSVRMQTR